MKIKYITWVIAIAVIFFVVTKPITADSLTDEDKAVGIAESLLQSTVVVSVFDGGGSGFYVSPYELITNQHVVKDTKSVLIKKGNGQMCLADVVFSQADTDLALLKTECEGKALAIADSVKVGQSVLAMGDPLGQEFYLSKGIVGLINSNGVLHDAAIEQGMSGGPVVGLNGQLVGVTKGSAKELPKMSIAIDTKTLSYFLFQAREVIRAE